MKLQILKIKITHHKAVEDGCIWEWIPDYECLSQSVSVLSSFKCSQRRCFQKKKFYAMLRKNNILFKKDTEKVLLQVKQRLNTNHYQVQGRQSFVHLYHTSILLLRGAKYLARKPLVILIWKWKARLISGTRFGSWFLKKVSRGACFFTVVLTCTKSFNKAYKKKLCTKVSNLFSP